MAGGGGGRRSDGGSGGRRREERPSSRSTTTSQRRRKRRVREPSYEYYSDEGAGAVSSGIGDASVSDEHAQDETVVTPTGYDDERPVGGGGDFDSGPEFAADDDRAFASTAPARVGRRKDVRKHVGAVWKREARSGRGKRGGVGELHADLTHSTASRLSFLLLFCFLLAFGLNAEEKEEEGRGAPADKQWVASEWRRAEQSSAAGGGGDAGPG